jgi:hypothetical protein
MSLERPITRLAGEMVWCNERDWLQHCHCGVTCSCPYVKAYAVMPPEDSMEAIGGKDEVA